MSSALLTFFLLQCTGPSMFFQGHLPLLSLPLLLACTSRVICHCHPCHCSWLVLSGSSAIAILATAPGLYFQGHLPLPSLPLFLAYTFRVICHCHPRHCSWLVLPSLCLVFNYRSLTARCLAQLSDEVSQYPALSTYLLALKWRPGW